MQNGKVALVCDDNLTSASSVKIILEKIGYSVDIAPDAKSAENLLDLKKYDLMILDIILPDKNGLVLLDEIRSNEKIKDLPIIILSATDKKEFAESVNSKITYWLEKSFDFSSLESLVNSIMNEKKADKAKILHLEDDEDLASIIALSLEGIADITSVKELTEAEKILKEHYFDVIILDYKLAGGTCEKLVDDIKFTPNRNAKLILFSAFEPTRELSRKFDKVILKTSVSYEQFLNCIKSLIKI